MELEGIDPIRLVVMENVFCTDLKIHEKYDLKVCLIDIMIFYSHSSR